MVIPKSDHLPKYDFLYLPAVSDLIGYNLSNIPDTIWELWSLFHNVTFISFTYPGVKVPLTINMSF